MNTRSGQDEIRLKELKNYLSNVSKLGRLDTLFFNCHI